MSGAQKNEYPILESTQQCDRLFENILKILRKRFANRATGQGCLSNSEVLVLDYQLRLQFWAGSVGVDADPVECLDIRLRNKPDLQRILHFESPIKRLNLVVHYIFKPRLGPPTLTPASGAALDAIQGSIERLDHLTVVIRQSSFNNSNLMLQTRMGTKAMDEDTLFEKTASLFVRGLLPDTPESLANQLVASVVYRRRRFLHQKTQPRRQSRQHQIQQESVTKTPIALDVASASHLIPPSVPRDDSRSVYTTSSTHLPPQPPEQPDGTYICNWCSEELSFKEWRDHMVGSHTQEWPQKIHLSPTWYCDFDHAELQKFSNPYDLEKHMGLAHTITENLTWKVKRSVLSQPRNPGICPLCNLNVFPHRENSDAKTLRALADSGNILDEEVVPHAYRKTAYMHTSSQTLDRHVAEHFKSLALLSIRYFEEDTLSASFGSLDNTFDYRSRVSDNSIVPQVANENASNANSVLKGLRESIMKAFVESAIDHQDFLPRDSFESLITPQCVQIVIESSAGKERISPSLAEFVFQKARKIFAILAITSTEILPAFESLRQYNFTDEDLPISRDTADDNCDINDTDRECTHSLPFHVFHHPPWDRSTIMRFYNEQWKFLAPVFTHNRLTQQLPPRPATMTHW
ncbi:hypothetical protein Hte_010569 [Hypoxylon texense]